MYMTDFYDLDDLYDARYDAKVDERRDNMRYMGALNFDWSNVWAYHGMDNHILSDWRVIATAIFPNRGLKYWVRNCISPFCTYKEFDENKLTYEEMEWYSRFIDYGC